MKTLVQNKHTGRFFYALIFASLFTAIGQMLPKIYFQYFDKTEYVSFAEPISFDRKLYAPCQDITALIRLRSSVSSSTVTRYRLKLVEVSSFRVVFGGEKQGFIRKIQGVEPLVTTFKLPCNLSTGNYFFTGVIMYRINGVEKTYNFSTEQFRVNKYIPAIIKEL